MATTLADHLKGVRYNVTFGRTYEKSETIIRWLGDESGKPLLDDLRDWREVWLKQMKTGRDMIDVARAQGAFEILDRILKMRQELKEGEQNVVEGPKRERFAP